jgi:hypothetical protein
VEFRTDTAKASTIRDGDLYGGVRIAMDATVAGAVVKLRLDISTGDPVAPPPTADPALASEVASHAIWTALNASWNG